MVQILWWKLHCGVAQVTLITLFYIIVGICSKTGQYPLFYVLV